MSPGLLPLLLGGLAAGAAVVALRDLIAGSPAATTWVRITVEPLRRARREGHLPTADERLRLGLLAAASAILAGWWLGGPVSALLLCLLGPLAVGAAIRRGRLRYRRSLERELPEVARTIADCLSAGDAPRGALGSAAASLEGPAAVEMARVRYELEVGRPTAVALDSLAGRFRSSRVDAFVTAMVSQGVAGGDLASLLRRFAEGAAERDRIEEDARSATAQARFTGYLVAAMPVGAALFVELLRPGFLASLTGSNPAMVLVGLSVLLQLAGFFAISKLAGVGRI